MSGVRFGVHSDGNLLHTAAYLDFQTCVRSLQDAGRGELAFQVWDSVAEVCHFPIPDEATLDLPGLPPMRRMPCLNPACDRCRRGQGGFKFPWVGVSSAQWSCVLVVHAVAAILRVSAGISEP